MIYDNLPIFKRVIKLLTSPEATSRWGFKPPNIVKKREKKRSSPAAESVSMFQTTWTQEIKWTLSLAIWFLSVCYWKWPIEIVHLLKMVIFHSFSYVYLRVQAAKWSLKLGRWGFKQQGFHVWSTGVFYCFRRITLYIYIYKHVMPYNTHHTISYELYYLVWSCINVYCIICIGIIYCIILYRIMLHFISVIYHIVSQHIILYDIVHILYCVILYHVISYHTIVYAICIHAFPISNI